MNNYKYIIKTLVFTLIFLVGCAPLQQKEKTEYGNYTRNTVEPIILAYGLYRIRIIGNVKVDIRKKCSEIDMIREAQRMYPVANDLINIKFDEKKVTTQFPINNHETETEVNYQCKGSAVAVAYEPITPKEAKEYKEVFLMKEIMNFSDSNFTTIPMNQVNKEKANIVTVPHKIIEEEE